MTCPLQPYFFFFPSREAPGCHVFPFPPSSFRKRTFPPSRRSISFSWLKTTKAPFHPLSSKGRSLFKGGRGPGSFYFFCRWYVAMVLFRAVRDDTLFFTVLSSRSSPSLLYEEDFFPLFLPGRSSRLFFGKVGSAFFSPARVNCSPSLPFIPSLSGFRFFFL